MQLCHRHNFLYQFCHYKQTYFFFRYINVVIIINMFHSTPSLIIKPSASWQSKLLGHLCHHQQKIFIINIVGFYQNNSFSAVSTDTLIPHPCLFMNITSTRVPVTHLNTSFPLWLRTVSGTHPPPPSLFLCNVTPSPPTLSRLDRGQQLLRQCYGSGP